jgi:hypothetical protein
VSSYVITVQAEHTDSEELYSLLSRVPEEVPSVSLKKPEQSGLAMDPGTIALVFGLAKVTVPVLITTIGTIWVAYINRRSANETSAPPVIDSQPTIVIETDDRNIHINIDSDDVERSVSRAELPETVDEMTRIRLLS